MFPGSFIGSAVNALCWEIAAKIHIFQIDSGKLAIHCDCFDVSERWFYALVYGRFEAVFDKSLSLSFSFCVTRQNEIFFIQIPAEIGGFFFVRNCTQVKK